MSSKLHFYNTIIRKKEEFIPANPPFVGMYVCGPTVYGDAHLGHARSAITFDIVFRYFGNNTWFGDENKDLTILIADSAPMA